MQEKKLKNHTVLVAVLIAVVVGSMMKQNYVGSVLMQGKLITITNTDQTSHGMDIHGGVNVSGSINIVIEFMLEVFNMPSDNSTYYIAEHNQIFYAIGIGTFSKGSVRMISHSTSDVTLQAYSYESGGGTSNFGNQFQASYGDKFFVRVTYFQSGTSCVVSCKMYDDYKQSNLLSSSSKSWTDTNSNPCNYMYSSHWFNKAQSSWTKYNTLEYAISQAFYADVGISASPTWNRFTLSKTELFDVFPFDDDMDDYPDTRYNMYDLELDYENSVVTTYDTYSMGTPAGYTGGNFQTYLEDPLDNVVDAIDTLITFPILDEVDVPLFGPIVNFLISLYNTGIVTGFEYISDMILGGFEGLILSFAYLIDESVIAGKNVIESNVPTIVNWVKTIVKIETVNPSVNNFNLGPYVEDVMEELEDFGSSALVDAIVLPDIEVHPASLLDQETYNYDIPIPTKFRFNFFSGTSYFNFDWWEVIFFLTKWGALNDVKFPLSEKFPYKPGSDAWHRSEHSTGDGFTIGEFSKFMTKSTLVVGGIYVAQKFLPISRIWKLVMKWISNQNVYKASAEDIIQSLGTTVNSKYELTGDSIVTQIQNLQADIDAIQTKVNDTNTKVNTIDTTNIDNIDEIYTEVQSISSDLTNALNVAIPGSIKYRLEELKDILTDIEYEGGQAEVINGLITTLDSLDTFIRLWNVYIDEYSQWVANPQYYSKPTRPT